MFSGVLKSNWRRTLIIGLLVLAVVALIAEFFVLVPKFQMNPPEDYDEYVDWANRFRGGAPKYPYLNPYPLPTTLWIFTPLSLLPMWFSVIWTLIPFAFVLWRYKRDGVILWLYYPMLVQAALGQLEGILLLPLYWLLENKRWLAGVGAVLMLFKPQLSFLAIGYALINWLVQRDWRNLGSFTATLFVIYLPAFIIQPTWPLAMLSGMDERANEFLLPTRGATLWAWIWRDGLTVWLAPIVAVISIGLVGYVFFVRQQRIQAMQLLGLLIMPVHYAVSFTTVIPTLKTRRELATLTAISWVGVVIDTFAGGWGGAYVIIPITALALLAFNPPSPREQIARTHTTATEMTNTPPCD
jgi:hypothetical protein